MERELKIIVVILGFVVFALISYFGIFYSQNRNSHNRLTIKSILVKTIIFTSQLFVFIVLLVLMRTNAFNWHIHPAISIPSIIVILSVFIVIDFKMGIFSIRNNSYKKRQDELHKELEDFYIQEKAILENIKSEKN